LFPPHPPSFTSFQSNLGSTVCSIFPCFLSLLSCTITSKMPHLAPLYTVFRCFNAPSSNTYFLPSYIWHHCRFWFLATSPPLSYTCTTFIIGVHVICATFKRQV
jgi:hypothetical protein